ncbi:MAG: NHLP bacteriocin system secretion protein, partial [Acidobacteriota bacterium]
GSGQVEAIQVAVGDVVEKGQVVARIAQEATLRQISDAEARREAQVQEYEDLQDYVREQLRLSAANQAQKRANLERQVETLNRQLEIRQENLAVQQGLRDEGLVTQQTTLQAEQEVNDVRDQLAARRLEIAGLELEQLEAEQSLQQQLEQRQTQIRDLDLQLRELAASIEESGRVLATETGRVLELVADVGDVVAPGTPILNMEIIAEDLMAAIFVPAELGKQIQPGMEARVTPSTVKREEHGFILGEVTWVSEFPATSRGMLRLLANQELVNRLLEAGPAIQIDVRLHEDPSTTTGYRWSSSGGPDLEISSGTLAAGSVIVRRDRPISLVVPIAKKAVGGGG